MTFYSLKWQISLPFHVPEAWKRYHLRTEPPKWAFMGVLSRANLGLKTIRTARKYMYSILKRTKSFLRLQSISPAQKEQITAERARFAWLILFFLQSVLVSVLFYCSYSDLVCSWDQLDTSFVWPKFNSKSSSIRIIISALDECEKKGIFCPRFSSCMKEGIAAPSCVCMKGFRRIKKDKEQKCEGNVSLPV